MPNFDTITKGALADAIQAVLSDAAPQLKPGEGLHISSLIHLLRMGDTTSSTPGGSMYVQLLGEIAELARDGVLHLEASYDPEDGCPGWDVFWGPKPKAVAATRGEVEGSAFVPKRPAKDGKKLAKQVKKLKKQLKALVERVNGHDNELEDLANAADVSFEVQDKEGALAIAASGRTSEQLEADLWLQHVSLDNLDLDTLDRSQLLIVAARLRIPSNSLSDDVPGLQGQIVAEWRKQTKHGMVEDENGVVRLFPDGVVVDRGIREGIFR